NNRIGKRGDGRLEMCCAGCGSPLRKSRHSVPRQELGGYQGSAMSQPDQHIDLHTDQVRHVGHSKPSKRWVIVLILLLAAALIILVVQRWIVSQGKRPNSANGPIASATHAVVPEAKFTDITSAAGIKFIHNNGASGDKLLPETMGGGVAFFDFDNDGHQD